jgi:DNA-binding Lrp family transcriptional regulator
MKLDLKDHQIINELRENARISIRDIAKKTKIRPSTVHQRIQKLIKENVIEKFTLKLNPSAINEEFVVFMFVKSKPSVFLDKKILQNPHIKEVFGITGEHDLLLKLKFKDVVEFNNFIIKFRKEQNIETTLTQVATANLKEVI